MQKKILIGIGVVVLILFLIGATTKGSKTARVSTAPTQQPQSTQPVEQQELTTQTPQKTGSTNKASTPEGLELYNQMEQLYADGAIKGMPFAEFDGDPIVDANPKTQSVQFGLKYDYEGTLPKQLKTEIAVDYDLIKSLAEKDSRLLMPGTKQLRLFVLTFHDKNGKGKGELQQLYIDDEPQWSEWK